MKRNRGKVISIVLIIASLIGVNLNLYAYSGKTDSNGGHKDNKNKYKKVIEEIKARPFLYICNKTKNDIE